MAYTLDIEKLRSQEQGPEKRSSFPHQLEAFEKLSRTFSLSNGNGKGALLVLPTGAGKTFTTVKWLCDNVVNTNSKILWLAHSFYLLDQAFQELHNYARWISEPRQTLNLRLVSSNPSHDDPGSIELTDDVLIMTTQTAIKNLHLDATDLKGNRVISKFRQYVEDGKRTGLFVILDEAHHAPAHGCRRLLVNQEESAPGIRRLLPQANLLGLTATPTYHDEARKGWLGKVFEAGVVYEAKKPALMMQGILARPNYIERPTGKELVVPDDLYYRLVRDHQDLPEVIIEKLANDSARNDYIVQEYVRNKDTYGKTIIFADRWFQAIYLKEKLCKKGIRADAIYNYVGGGPGTAEERNKRTASDNQRILNEFKYGKDGKDTLDVLINIRMLTEGADVPSVRSVFLTRQTTSPVLMTQMIGRALRGKNAGGGEGKEEANIVLFMDEWKRLVDWATPGSLEGETDDQEAVVRGYRPLEYVSIRLVEELAKAINSGGTAPHPPFTKMMPVGWYQAEFVVAVSENISEERFGETQSVAEFVMVYEDTKPKFEAFIDHLLRNLPEGWDREFLPSDWVSEQVGPWLTQFFHPVSEHIGNSLEMDLARIARHTGQRLAAPVFHSFEERGKYDLDLLARKRLKNNPLENEPFLQAEFNQPGRLWKLFYKSYERFASAFLFATMRAVRPQSAAERPSPVEPKPRRRRELSEAEKEQVKKRDNHTCLCCGATGRGVRLEVDHIIPYALGGETTVENSQSLCSVCNAQKIINELNFRLTASPGLVPTEIDLLPRSRTEDVKQALTRLINSFYRCGAVCEIRMHERSNGRFYSTWEIELFAANDPKWLKEHKEILLAHIRDDFGCPHVKNIKILGAK